MSFATCVVIVGYLVGAAFVAVSIRYAKQMGSHVITRNDELSEWPEPFGHDESERYQGAPIRMRLRDSHGGDWSEWPEDMRVREMPKIGGRDEPFTLA